MKIISFPEDKNPYQGFLHNELTKKKIIVSYIKFWSNSFILNTFEIFPQLFIHRLRGFKIFHLHWLYKFKFPIDSWIFNNFITKIIFSIYLIILLLFIKLLGYKLIWTIHNIIPHEQIFINDLFITKLIIYFSKKVIVHDSNSFKTLKEMDIDVNKIHIIPIGFYNVNKKFIQKSVARQALNIPSKNFVFLFFGLIRKYKGVDKLLESYKKLAKKIDNINLIILGECDNSDLFKLIRSSEKVTASIKSEIKYISDDKLNSYLSACDVVVLPYKKVTTSSTAILAFSFCRTVIAPKIGPFIEFNDQIGYFYDPDNNDGLYSSLLQSINDSNIEEKNTKALNFVKKFNWSEIAGKTINVYKN